MHDLLSFAQTVSPLGVIALLVIVILQLVRSLSFGEIFKSKERKDKTEVIVKLEEVTLQSLNKKLDKIAGNHLHDLPQIHANVISMMEDVKDIKKEQVEQGNRITRVETILEEER